MIITMRRVLKLLLVLPMLACSQAQESPQNTNEVRQADIQVDDQALLFILGEVSDADKLRNAKGLQELIKFANHGDYLVRVRAVKALGQPYYREETGAHQALLFAVNDTHWFVRSFAIRALGYGKHEDVREALEKRLQIEAESRVIRHIQNSLTRIEQEKTE